MTGTELGQRPVVGAALVLGLDEAFEVGHRPTVGGSRSRTNVEAMDYRGLGTTGMQVSNLCLGAMMFGAWGEPDHDESVRIIHHALDSGVNFIDTADVYSQGESEVIVGKALAGGRRDDVILATKVHGPMGVPVRAAKGDPNRKGNSRRWIVREVEDSLRRLQHRLDRPLPDPPPGLRDRDEETLSALTDLQRQGKIRAFGSSTYPAHQIVEAQWTAERRGLGRFVTEQPPYSILVRGIEADVLPTTGKYGMGVIPWSPLAGGWLSGRSARASAPQPTAATGSRPVRPVDARRTSASWTPPTRWAGWPRRPGCRCAHGDRLRAGSTRR